MFHWEKKSKSPESLPWKGVSAVTAPGTYTAPSVSDWQTALLLLKTPVKCIQTHIIPPFQNLPEFRLFNCELPFCKTKGSHFPNRSFNIKCILLIWTHKTNISNTEHCIVTTRFLMLTQRHRRDVLGFPLCPLHEVVFT